MLSMIVLQIEVAVLICSRKLHVTVIEDLCYGVSRQVRTSRICMKSVALSRLQNPDYAGSVALPMTDHYHHHQQSMNDFSDPRLLLQASKTCKMMRPKSIKRLRTDGQNIFLFSFSFPLAASSTCSTLDWSSPFLRSLFLSCWRNNLIILRRLYHSLSDLLT